jgi:hypothetical protein
MCIWTLLTSALELAALPISSTSPKSAKLIFLFIFALLESEIDGCPCVISEKGDNLGHTNPLTACGQGVEQAHFDSLFFRSGVRDVECRREESACYAPGMNMHAESPSLLLLLKEA